MKLSMRTQRIDALIWNLLLAICCVLLFSIVMLTAYTVFMRYAMNDPPFWGDTTALFANVWLVMLCLAITVRYEESISLQGLYSALPRIVGVSLDMLWNIVTLLFGLFLVWYGWQAAMKVPGMFWELGGLPKRYPMLIMPISGGLTSLAAALVLYRQFTDRNASDNGSQASKEH
jgi:TRAP-type C4-dicarboxylate transport system permease small subunit